MIPLAQDLIGTKTNQGTKFSFSIIISKRIIHYNGLYLKLKFSKGVETTVVSIETTLYC